MFGIIAAMTCELEGLTAAAENVTKEEVLSIEYVRGTLDGVDVVMAVSGEGKVNAAVCAQTMILRYGATTILNTGVAGSLSPTLHVPDVAIAHAAVQHDYDLSPLGYPVGKVLCGHRSKETPDGDSATVFFPADVALADALLTAATEMDVHAECGVIATGDCFVADGELKKSIVSRYGAIACEMEGGAIAQACHVAGVPFGILRAISDNADENAPEAFSPLRAAEISIAVTRRALAILQAK